MFNRPFLLTFVIGALTVCGIALTSQSSVAEAGSAPASRASHVVATPDALQLHAPSIDCRFVACASDFDCQITTGCSHNTCSNPAPGQAFGQCTVRPQ
jgi:hypothetical protein